MKNEKNLNVASPSCKKMNGWVEDNKKHVINSNGGIVENRRENNEGIDVDVQTTRMLYKVRSVRFVLSVSSVHLSSRYYPQLKSSLSEDQPPYIITQSFPSLSLVVFPLVSSRLRTEAAAALF